MVAIFLEFFTWAVKSRGDLTKYLLPLIAVSSNYQIQYTSSNSVSGAYYCDYCSKILTQTSLNLVWWFLPTSSWGVGSFQSAGVNSGQANRTRSDGAFSRLIDAFSSLSWQCLHFWQLNTRSDSFMSWTWPHLEQVFELGNHRSTKYRRALPEALTPNLLLPRTKLRLRHCILPSLVFAFLVVTGV